MNPQGEILSAGHYPHAKSVRGEVGRKTKLATSCALNQMVPAGGDSITSIRAVNDALLASQLMYKQMVASLRQHIQSSVLLLYLIQKEFFSRIYLENLQSTLVCSIYFNE